jgi:hypothetical protein
MKEPDWTTGSRASLPNSSADEPWFGKSIVLRHMDLLEPEETDGPGDSEQSYALMLTRKMYTTDDYLQGEYSTYRPAWGFRRSSHHGKSRRVWRNEHSRHRHALFSGREAIAGARTTALRRKSLPQTQWFETYEGKPLHVPDQQEHELIQHL